MQFSVGIPSGDTGLAMPFGAHQSSVTRPQKVQKNKKSKKEGRRRFHSSRTSAAKTRPKIASTSSAQEILETTPPVTDEPTNEPGETVCGHYRIKYIHSLEKCRHFVEKIRKCPQKNRLFRKEEAAEKPRTTAPAIELQPAVRPMTRSQNFIESARHFKEELASRDSSWEFDPQFWPQNGPDHFRTEMASARRKSQLEAEKKATAAAAETTGKDEDNEKDVENSNPERITAEVTAGPSYAGNSQGFAGSSSEDEAASFSDISDSRSVDESTETEEESTEEDEEIESFAEFSDGEIFGESEPGYHTASNPNFLSGLEVGCHSPYCDSGSDFAEDANPELLISDRRDSENNYGDEYSRAIGVSSTEAQSSALPLSAGNMGNYTLSSVIVPSRRDATPRTTFEVTERGLSSLFKDLKSAAKCFSWARIDRSGERGDMSRSRKRASSFLALEDEFSAENDSAISRSAPARGFKMASRPQPKQARNSHGDYSMRDINYLFGEIHTRHKRPSLYISLNLDTLDQCIRFSRELDQYEEILVICKARELLHENKTFSALQVELANFNSKNEEACKDLLSKVAFPAKPATVSQLSFSPMKTRYARQPIRGILRNKRNDFPTIPISGGHYVNTEQISGLEKELSALSLALRDETMLLAAVPDSQGSIQATFQKCLLLTIKSSACAKTHISQYISFLLEVKRELFTVFDRLAGAGHEYGLFLEELASTPSSNRALKYTERRLSSLLKPIKKAKKLLKGVSNGARSLKRDFSQHVPILVKLVQTVISSRNACMLFNEEIGMNTELDPDLKAQYREMVSVSTPLKHHAALWDVDTFKNALNYLSLGIAAVSDVKIDLEMNMGKIIGKIGDLQTPPVGAKDLSDSESVEVLQPRELDHRMDSSKITADSLNPTSMSSSIQSSSVLSGSPLSSGA
ncbi:hypothetical protein OXX69_009456 [Metschnikowia pulcherrima]